VIYKVKWTRPARKDVREIKRHIAIDSEWYSVSVTSDIVKMAADIGRHPNRFTICPEWKSDKTHHRLVHGYRIIYDIKGSMVIILGVIHETRLISNVVGHKFRS
jgi:plasmid stabilization system protein ParE